MKLPHRCRAAVIGLILLAYGQLAAAAESSAEPAFAAAFSRYAAEMDAYRRNGFMLGLSTPGSACDAIEAAYALGKRQNVAAPQLAELAASYGATLGAGAAAERELDYALDMLAAWRKQHDDGEELIRPLMQIGHLAYTFNGARGAEKHYRQAFKLAERFWPGEARLADVYLEAGVHLSGRSHLPAKDYMNSALEIYSALPGSAARARQAETAMHLGRFWIRRRQHLRAEEYLNDGLAALGTPPSSQELFIGLHTQLVRLYDASHKPVLAAQHTQIIAQAAAANGNAPPTLLYSVGPSYPPNALRLNETGYVTLRFTVNALGEVVDPVVVARTGHHELEAAAIKAMKLGRFAPRVVDGKPVATDGVEFTYQFGIVK